MYVTRAIEPVPHGTGHLPHERKGLGVPRLGGIKASTSHPLNHLSYQIGDTLVCNRMHGCRPEEFGIDYHDSRLQAALPACRYRP